MINNKGFTLIELIAAIAIMALISMAAVPSLKNMLSNNEKKKFDYYSISIENAGKLYFRREKTDIIDNPKERDKLRSNSGIVVCIDELKSINLIEDFGGDYICHGGVIINQTTGDSSGFHTNFYPFLKCKEGTNWSDGELIYTKEITSSNKNNIINNNYCNYN